MKKKYLRPAPKTDDETKKAADEKNSRRRLSVKKIILIAVAALIVCTAVIVPVCIVYVDTPVKPAFSDFSQQDDYTITIKWNKITAATSYDIEYCRVDPESPKAEIIKASTENNRYTLQRYAGELYFRVRAVKNARKGSFSDWIHYTMDAWIMGKPSVMINSASLQVSWSAVNFRYYNDYSQIAPAYIYSFGWQLPEEEIKWNANMKSTTSNIDLTSALFSHSHFKDYFQGMEYEWPGDMTLYFKVAALNYSLYSIGFTKYVDVTPELQALNQIYTECGEYGEAKLVITKEIFDALPKP